MMCTDAGLVRYETFYKMLDLYYQFSTRLGKNIDADRLVREREKTEETIMRYLAKNKRIISENVATAARRCRLEAHLWCVTDATGRRGAAGDSTAWGRLA